jgi:hypothetical protein
VPSVVPSVSEWCRQVVPSGRVENRHIIL